MKLLKLLIFPIDLLTFHIQLNPFDKDFSLTSLAPGLDFVGGLLGMNSQKEINQQNWKNQIHMAKHGLGYRIKDAAKYGIHPLAAIGAIPGPSATIPMQNEMSHMSSALKSMAQAGYSDKDGAVDAQIKQYVLAEAKRKALDSKYDYSLLIPVEHPQYPGIKWWGFNSRYQAFGSFANTVVMASNYDQALELMKQNVDEKTKAIIDEHKQKNVKKRNKQFSPKSKKPGANIYDDMGGSP